MARFNDWVGVRIRKRQKVYLDAKPERTRSKWIRAAIDEKIIREREQCATRTC